MIIESLRSQEPVFCVLKLGDRTRWARLCGTQSEVWSFSPIVQLHSGGWKYELVFVWFPSETFTSIFLAGLPRPKATWEVIASAHLRSRRLSKIGRWEQRNLSLRAPLCVLKGTMAKLLESEASLILLSCLAQVTLIVLSFLDIKSWKTSCAAQHFRPTFANLNHFLRRVETLYYVIFALSNTYLQIKLPTEPLLKHSQWINLILSSSLHPRTETCHAKLASPLTQITSTVMVPTASLHNSKVRDSEYLCRYVFYWRASLDTQYFFSFLRDSFGSMEVVSIVNRGNSFPVCFSRIWSWLINSLDYVSLTITRYPVTAWSILAVP